VTFSWTSSLSDRKVPKVSIGAVRLDLFPIAPLGEIAWVGFALGLEHFHVCYTAVKKGKNS